MADKLISLTWAYAWYSHQDAVHGLDHVLRVVRLAEKLAYAEGADIEIVRAAALLHDVPEHIAAVSSQEGRFEHEKIAATFAGTFLEAQGWESTRIEAVQHCIRAHRFRLQQEEPQTLEARVVFDADKLDAIGAVGVARAIACAVQAGQPIYAPASERFIQTGEYEPDEPHSAYHEFIFKLRKIQQRLYTASARQMALERHAFMEAFFERLAEEWQGLR